MPYTRFRVRTSGGSMVNIAPNVNNRLNVRDAGGTNREITNSPDAAPPTGEFPVRKRDNSQVTIPFFVIQQANPLVVPAVPGVTITSPVDPWNVNYSDPVLLAADCTLNGSSTSAANVVWTSSLMGDLYTGATTTLKDLTVGTHLITATFSNPPDPNPATDTVTVTVANVATPPTVTILSPVTGQDYSVGSAITCNATAMDAVNGDLSEDIRWYDTTTRGVLYTGKTFSLKNLKPGTHTIIASCADKDLPPNEGQDSVTINIVAIEPDVTRLALQNEVVIGRQAYGSGVVQ